ncbi:MAG: hypothetical protein LAN36_01065 [Acidobacteriia bacterium]|nr:hypothetical protein [Terriglobia bacterium]
MKQLWEAGDFIRKLRRRMRFGKLSRAPLRLLRLEVRGEVAECEWLARPADIWAATLPRPVRERDASLQALQDAIALREMLFSALPDVETAELRVFRQSAREPPELIVIGTVTREAPAVARVTSPAMRAKLYGFQFRLDDGILGLLEVEDSGLQLMISA